MTIRDFPNEQEVRTYIPHYYGDLVRTMFIIAAIVMLVSFPFFSELIAIPTLISPAVIIALAVVAGLMNPRQKWVLIFNAVVSVIAFLILEYHAYYAFTQLDRAVSLNVAFFWVSQVLSVFFFFASYLSVKTVRGRYVKELEERSRA